ncbi:MAG: hypothetical protein LBB45_00135 [Methanobrevibacter sp.]|jgi:KEOPS complex subunit Pcc1|nr:hypothetical protein [Candidatus Methanovirga basalitermitum]
MLENYPNILNHVKGKIVINFDSRKEADIIYRSICLELKTAPDHRSKADIEVKNESMIIYINSHDMTSFRASINSIIKWIKLSHEMIDIVQDMN